MSHAFEGIKESGTCYRLLRLAADRCLPVEQLSTVVTKLGVVATSNLDPPGVLGEEMPVCKNPTGRRNTIV
jgi:hypothetical protein